VIKETVEDRDRCGLVDLSIVAIAVVCLIVARVWRPGGTGSLDHAREAKQ